MLIYCGNDIIIDLKSEINTYIFASKNKKKNFFSPKVNKLFLLKIIHRISKIFSFLGTIDDALID
jgi:hypothetical protein